MCSTALDFKPSDADTINLNLGFTRSWFQTPNSYDAQNATAWSGLVVDNGGLGPNGLPVGSAGSALEDPNIQHCAGLDASAESEHGVHVRRFRAAGSIQLLSERRSLRRSHARSANEHHRPEPKADKSGASRKYLVR